jgi:hypothetical protein
LRWHTAKKYERQHDYNAGTFSLGALNMGNANSPLRAFLTTALGAMVLLTQLTAVAKTPEPAGLFSEQEDAAPRTPGKKSVKGKSQAVKVNVEKLRRGRIFIKLPDGSSYEAVRDTQQERSKGRFSWVGHASDGPENRVVIGVSGAAVAGTFFYRGKLFRLEPRADGSHVLSEVQTTDPAPELDPIPVSDSSAIAPNTAGTGSAAADGNGQVIDVLVAYTPAVKALYGTQGTDALILQAVAEANQAYANSAMSTRLNLVNSVLTNYTESGDMGTDLSRLRSTNEGYMDEIHVLRNQYGADVVSLMENEPQYCGLAYRMATLSAGFASSAFSIVHHSCATGYFSFAHEIGHNQGAHHDYANASGGAAIFPFAYGYPEPNNAFRTIMAYNCPGGCVRISHFSNAQVLYNGLPTGYTGSAENAVAIDDTAPTVAAFRQLALALPPAAPGGLGSAVNGPGQIDLTWNDMSANETGFALERSNDGLNFVQIASLIANSTSYHDDNLAADTLYYYRARAWNSSGNSPYSNLTTVATSAEPTHVDRYAVADINAGGSVAGVLQDTWSKDGRTESITEKRSAGVAGQRYGFLEHYWAFEVAPGESVTLYADVNTSSTSQSFTFAYSTVAVGLAADQGAWVDMFTVSAQTPGVLQFDLPATLSGNVYISVRDEQRVPGVTTRDTVNIDYLAISTRLAPGEVVPPPVQLPPGC